MIASEADKKNSADIRECYPPQLSASVDNTVLDLQNSSYPTQPHSIIANYTTKAVVFNKTRTPATSLPFKGQVTEVKIVKWSIVTKVQG